MDSAALDSPAMRRHAESVVVWPPAYLEWSMPDHDPHAPGCLQAILHDVTPVLGDDGLRDVPSSTIDFV